MDISLILAYCFDSLRTVTLPSRGGPDGYQFVNVEFINYSSCIAILFKLSFKFAGLGRDSALRRVLYFTTRPE